MTYASSGLWFKWNYVSLSSIFEFTITFQGILMICQFKPVLYYSSNNQFLQPIPFKIFIFSQFLSKSKTPWLIGKKRCHIVFLWTTHFKKGDIKNSQWNSSLILFYLVDLFFLQVINEQHGKRQWLLQRKKNDWCDGLSDNLNVTKCHRSGRQSYSVHVLTK